MYNKIIEQSKTNSILNEINYKKPINFEILQINLSLILWYMKGIKIEKKYINFLINKFINDLEQASIELGFGETGLKKEVRKLAKNFYNNLDFNLQIINEILKKKHKISIKIILKKKFNEKVFDINKLEYYYKNNIDFFLNLDEKSFWKLNFNFIQK